MSDDSDFLTRTGKADGDDEIVAAGDAFAIVRGQRKASALKFIRERRTTFVLAYGYLPVLWWHRPDLLLAEYPGLFTVSLSGHGLDDLIDRISDQKVTWLRECPHEEASGLPVAITRIDILQTFPSREVGD